MKRTRVWALFLALLLALSLTACGGASENASGAGENPDAAPAEGAGETAEETEAGQSAEAAALDDLAYVTDKGTLIVGITEFEPMDYQDADGNWIGFDADLARAFAESIGVEPVFQIVDWDNKVFELDGMTIDVVWNGMTLTDEVLNSMECSNPYFNNAQVVVVRADGADSRQTLEGVQDLLFAVENGSAGKAQAEENGFTFTEVSDQATALLEVSSGTADAAIVDSLMALAMTGEGTSYADLTHTLSLNSEEYGVGFRKGSDLAAALNDFFRTSYADGSMQEIAARYNIADALIAQ